MPATGPSLTGSGKRQVFDLSSSLPAEPALIDLLALQVAQEHDTDAARSLAMKGFHLQYVMFRKVPIMCDISTGVPRPVVPADLRPRVFMVVNELSHAGTRATRPLIANR